MKDALEELANAPRRPDREIYRDDRGGWAVAIGPDSYDLNPCVKLIDLGLMPEDEDRVIAEFSRSEVVRLLKALIDAWNDEW